MGFFYFQEKRGRQRQAEQEAKRRTTEPVRLQKRKSKVEEEKPMPRVLLTRPIKLRTPATLAWSNPNPLTEEERMFQR